MFRRISYTIALQFTAFVFLLLLINGSIFLFADYRNARFESQNRLMRTMDSIVGRPYVSVADLARSLPPMVRERVRVVDKDGAVLYSGGLFDQIPFSDDEGFFEWVLQGEQYRLLTAPIRRGDELYGYLQIVDVERFQRGDVPRRGLLYLLVSVGISMLTFFVGLFFARRSLKPAEAMVQRLEQFTQDASHELRTPIAVLSSSLDLALKSGRHEQGIASAKEDLRQISVLVERLLELARLDTFTLKRHAVDFSGLVNQSVEKHKLLAEEKKITINADIAPGVTVTGDDALLRQVVGNLLSNAIKFNAEKGTITVTLQKGFLSVQDTGIGIAASDLPQIFDRFYQADASRARGGLGLGLALVKRIVDLHGWTISARSVKGKGTTFRVQFSAKVA